MPQESSAAGTAPSFKLIALSGDNGAGKFAKVSPHQYDWLVLKSWHLGKGYPCTNVYSEGVHRTVPMHKFLLPSRFGYEIDHRDRDRLNNTDENLRYATHRQNMQNIGPRGMSEYKGCVWHQGGACWNAGITLKGRYEHLGTWENEIEAALAYDAAARYYFGEFAYLNFPQVNEALSAVEIRRRCRADKGHGTPYYGVNFAPERGVYVSQFTYDGRTRNIGYGFRTAEAAARAHDAVELFFYGREAKTNFDDVEPLSIPQIRRQLRRAALYDLPHRGVKRTPEGRYLARVCKDGKQEHLGVFNKASEAAKCVDACVRYLFGEDTQTNFPGSERVSPEEMRQRNVWQRRHKEKTSSKYVGVYWHKKSSKWLARAYLSGEKASYLGLFKDEKDAAKTVDDALSADNLARLNFPEDTTPTLASLPLRKKSSQYRGVTWHKGSRKWYVTVVIEGKTKYVGKAATEEEAARMADDARVANGQTRVNFPV